MGSQLFFYFRILLYLWYEESARRVGTQSEILWNCLIVYSEVLMHQLSRLMSVYLCAPSSLHLTLSPSAVLFFQRLFLLFTHTHGRPPPKSVWISPLDMVFSFSTPSFSNFSLCWILLFFGHESSCLTMITTRTWLFINSSSSGSDLQFFLL